ncbi:hypothetical protein C9994_01985 [Marivirga lumbricoides]|uniref:Uncharacterized protein n=1 Tax=Marivirga lumbricoides TaxID=1046115 RepID=A0A2T4DUZ2_9BACT|nr:hypothetical protein C9994_01985 [Marivirga lumbricoides]
MHFINDPKIEIVSNRELTSHPDDINSFIEELKSVNASLILTILARKLKLSLKEVTHIVLNSPAWIEHKESFYQFNEGVFKEWSKNADKVEVTDDKISLTFDLKKDLDGPRQ